MKLIAHACSGGITHCPNAFFALTAIVHFKIFDTDAHEAHRIMKVIA
ncbi:MAG TPA: hypothetical protein VFT53_01385 [Candidatus Saccharimonadales bacterium]|nr:hypothetical protein [Candidatus Saccharimonadales bacterium]